MERAPQVLIMEDHDIVASAVANIARENIPNAQVTKVRTFTSGLRLMHSGLSFDLIVLDVNLPGGESYAMVPALRELQPGVRVLIFTGNDESKHALHFLSAGANGFLSKSAPMEEVGVAIRMIMAEKKYMTEEVQQRVADKFFRKISAGTTNEQEQLSPRESEVLALLLDGRQTKQIALSLRLKITTVSTHKARIFSKLGVTNLMELFQKMKSDD